MTGLPLSDRQITYGRSTILVPSILVRPTLLDPYRSPTPLRFASPKPATLSFAPAPWISSARPHFEPAQATALLAGARLHRVRTSGR